MFLGLRTVIYPAPDLEAATTFFTSLLGLEPYFEQPFYVGYSVGGYELGLDPHADPAAGPRTYWGVDDTSAALAELLAAGGTEVEPVTEVGDGISVASVMLPTGLFGVIHNPTFSAS